MRRWLLVALLLAGTADADDTCAPLDAATFRASVEAAHAALLDDDVVRHDALVGSLRARLPCLVEVVPADAWARLLYEDALVRQAIGEPWHALVAAAVSADPLLDRSLGAPEVRDYVPAPGTASVARPDDVPDRWWVDGHPAPDPIDLTGPHVLQRRDALRLQSALVVDGAPLPSWWAPEPEAVAVPGPSPEPRRRPTVRPTNTSRGHARKPAPAPSASEPVAEGRLALRVHVATGVQVAFGDAFASGGVEEPATKVIVPVEAGVELDVAKGWVRLAGEFAPLVDGTWVYDRDGSPFATHVGGGVALSGGGRFGIGHFGALVGGRDPSRFVFQAVGGVQVHDSGLRIEGRAGVDLTTSMRVEPAVGLLLVFAPRVWSHR
jgi:hypothetical protein